MLEITEILTALVKHVEQIAVNGHARAENAILRGFAELEIELA